MKNLKVLLEIITELRAENEALKLKDTTRSNDVIFWYERYKKLEQEQKEIISQN